MKFIDGADVFTPQNEKVGSVDRVVLDPKTKEVSHIVVRKGFLLKEDRVIPIEDVDRVVDDDVFLKGDIQDLANYPEFEETHYLLADEFTKLEKENTKYARPFLWYPPYGYARMGGIPYAPSPMYYAATQRNIPEDTVPLKEGAKVISADGKHVGNVEEVLVDPKQERATHIVVEEGLLFTDRKLLPTIWVTHLFENEIHIAMKSSTLKKLPKYEG
jgi:uncharacterized protein YrrD